MPQNSALEIALRVLSAINNHRPPDPNDLSALRRLAAAAASEADDELACSVVRQQLRQTPASSATLVKR